MDIHQVHINFLSQGLVLNLIDKSFFIHFLETVFLIFQHDGCCSSGVDCSDDVREVAFQLVDVCDGLVHVFFNLSYDFSKLLVVDWEIVLEHSDCLFTGFSENYCDFVDEVYF